MSFRSVKIRTFVVEKTRQVAQMSGYLVSLACVAVENSNLRIKM